MTEDIDIDFSVFVSKNSENYPAGYLGVDCISIIMFFVWNLSRRLIACSLFIGKFVVQTYKPWQTIMKRILAP